MPRCADGGVLWENTHLCDVQLDGSHDLGSYMCIIYDLKAQAGHNISSRENHSMN